MRISDWSSDVCSSDLLTFSIHLIGALAYAARIAGVRTRRIAMSFALFNVLVLVSRLSNSFLGPFLAKRIETALADGIGEDRKSVVWGKSVSVRVDLGGRSIIKKKNKKQTTPKE